jgi:signal transduction histidine kinase
VALAREDDQVVLEVSDEGIGIAEDDQASLFEEFFRTGNPAVLEQPGTGLGLAIVKRIVERHEGSIAVRSAPGSGSTFVVRLPAA